MPRKTRKRKSSAQSSARRRKTKKNNQESELIRTSQRVLNKQQEISQQVINNAKDNVVKSIGNNSRALGLILSDKQVQGEINETLEKSLDALAAIAENGAGLMEEAATKFAPAANHFTFAIAEMVNNIGFDAAMGVIGLVPVVGDALSSVLQISKATGQGVTSTIFSAVSAMPVAVGLAGKAIENAE